jgi:glycosyltransferase involved in cell wall biosynthesis
VRACARLSRWLPERIICCAESARQIHVGWGYAAERMEVIPNGFDTELFRPDPAARAQVRRELGIAAEIELVGMFARFHAQKDHRSFLSAAAALLRQRPAVRFLLCGDEITWENRQLAGWIDAEGLRPAVILLGRRPDLPRLTTALDLAVSASACGEAFSNTLGEAMACAVPCVATRVGDAPLIIGATGRLVEPRQPEPLATAMAELLALPPGERTRLGWQARRRIEERFALAGVVRQYEEIYRSFGPAAVPALTSRRP